MSHANWKKSSATALEQFRPSCVRIHSLASSIKVVSSCSSSETPAQLTSLKPACCDVSDLSPADELESLDVSFVEDSSVSEIGSSSSDEVLPSLHEGMEDELEDPSRPDSSLVSGTGRVASGSFGWT